MIYNFSKCFTYLVFACSFFAFTGCDSGEDDVKAEMNAFSFDQQVINKLPLYDSMVSAIIRNFPSFSKYIRDKDSYHSFRYIPGSEELEVFFKLPPAAAPAIDPIYNSIGKDHIYGFEIFRDSSVKVFVRTRLTGSKVDITEFMSYFSGGNFRKREFPEKDTILDKHWQYWARFDKRGAF
ncbi:MAG TPA: hypothetical protein VHL77_11665 [Ferruginibacter sp.]|jgi:hypothetical protein|nr:hypothetical protein [Ferruginibacter sp.]